MVKLPFPDKSGATMKRLPLSALMTLFLVGAPLQAQTFFGEDLDGDAYTRSSLTNATNAESMFLSMLAGVGTEGFDGFSVGTSAPQAINFTGAGTATLTGAGSVSSAPAGSANGAGRYGVSDPNFWEVSVGGPTVFTIDFTNPIAAFGFYGIDVGDFGGQMSLNFMAPGGGTTPVTVPHTVGAGGNPDGAAFYFGYIDVLNPFESVEFAFNDPSGGIDADVFAFDNMTIGTRAQVRVPEPMSAVLLGTGLLGFAVVSWRRREDEV